MGQVSEALQCVLPDSQREAIAPEKWLHDSYTSSLVLLRKTLWDLLAVGEKPALLWVWKTLPPPMDMLWKYLLAKSHGTFLQSIFFLAGFSIDRRGLYACKIMLHWVRTLEKRRTENRAEENGGSSSSLPRNTSERLSPGDAALLPT